MRYLVVVSAPDEQAALRAAEQVQSGLEGLIEGLPLRATRLAPFMRDVQAARQSPLLRRQDLAGTSFASLVDSLLVHEDGRWQALLPLSAPTSGPHAGRIDFAQVRHAVATAAPGAVWPCP